MRKIRKNDEVMVLRGSERGRTGKVLDVDLETGKATVEGMNLRKKHRRRSAKHLKAGIEELPAPIPVCALALVSKKDGKAVRVRIETRETGGKARKVRVAVRTGEVFD
ncbi:MAG: 50S ribosomal protein L24 [Deltaproteobacteria bacterium]|nr:50S ribosomal protein L24 [Deltaproteobacteria bacterium]